MNRTMFTWLSNPNVINMKKKQIAQNGAPGIKETASGYATNAKPGPVTHRQT
jgi:hypothetical protein